jgi:uncharacterized membrane protein YecN with MAPEG domain
VKALVVDAVGGATVRSLPVDTSSNVILLIVGLAAIEVWVFGLIVGRARGRYGVAAPATSGHPDWERLNRVHQNSIEQLVVFLPLFLLYATTARDTAPWVGALFVVARVVYAMGYAKSPAGRTAGAALTFLAQLWLALGVLIGISLRLVR